MLVTFVPIVTLVTPLPANTFTPMPVTGRSLTVFEMVTAPPEPVYCVTVSVPL